MALQGWGKVRNLEAPPSAVGGGVPIRRKHVRGPRVSTQADWRRSPPLQPGRADAKRRLLLPMLNRRKPAGDVNNLGNAMVPENG